MQWISGIIFLGCIFLGLGEGGQGVVRIWGGAMAVAGVTIVVDGRMKSEILLGDCWVISKSTWMYQSHNEPCDVDRAHEATTSDRQKTKQSLK